MPRGGARKGAGRPKGQGKFGEPTRAIRVPERMVQEVLQWIEGPSYALPLYSSQVAAGFPSPADDHIEGSLDLNEYLIDHPAATFFVRVSGDSMIEAGIFEDDILVVDRSVNACSGKVVIAAVDGQLTVKRLIQEDGKTFLKPENAAYQPIELTEGNEVHIWGVVTSVIHQV